VEFSKRKKALTTSSIMRALVLGEQFELICDAPEYEVA